MSTTTERMLRLLSLLQTHRYWAGAELADRLEVSSRTLRRDVERLRTLGYPVDATRGVAGGYQLQAGAALPPLLLDDDEAIAIAVGLRGAAGGPVSGIEDASVRALTKVVRMMPPRLRGRVDALQAFTSRLVFDSGPDVDAEALAIMAQACRDRERLRFEYTPREGSRATRLVEPSQMVMVGRRWYLVAWDVDRSDWRTYRVDRLTDPRSTRYRFTGRVVPGGDAVAFVRDQLAAVPTRYRVVMRLAADAAAVRSVVGEWAEVEPLDEASSRMTMNVDSLEWPAMILAAVGAEFEVEEPDDFRVYVARMGTLFGRAAVRSVPGG
jgi:predicted DNA-binding transcriptional regulator YafY